MGEKGLSVADGDETFDDDVFESESETITDDRTWMPEREPAFASDQPAPLEDASDDAASGDALGVASGG